MLFRTLLFSSLVASAHFAAISQEPVKLEPDAISQLIDHRVEPSYPPIAKAAHVSGTVVFDVVIGPTGRLDSERVVSGPAMLQQAAINALKQWTFHPYEQKGSAVPVSGKVLIDFGLGKRTEAAKKDEEIAERYFEASDECHKAIAKQDNSPEAGAICKKAADITDEFATGGRFIEKRSSYVYAAWALANCKDFKTALPYANKAVAIVQLGHDDNSGKSAAYGIRGIVEGDLDDLPAADHDLTIAEEDQRKALAWANEVNFEHKDSYKASLAMYLRLHSKLLLALNRPDEAKKKLDEMENFK
jgi:TonB family protein